MPINSVVKDAKLVLSIEHSPRIATRIYLYSVNKDWNPGKGGIYKDNTSPPSIGEVWWNDNSFKERSWGLPGASFASDSHTQADTPKQFLASTIVKFGDKKIFFHSKTLSEYINERMNLKKPLLFMVKPSDYLEDTPNSRFSIYAANYGDDRNTQRRPKLILKWESKNEIKSLVKKISLEYGRDYIFPKLIVNGSNYYHVSLFQVQVFDIPLLGFVAVSWIILSPGRILPKI